MRTVRFVRDTDPQREGGPGFKLGDVRSLNPRSAQRWVLRGAAVYEADAKADEPGPAQEPEKDQKQQQEQEPDQPKEEASGDTVVSPADDVEGSDGAGAGERSEPDADAASSKSSGGGRSGGGSGGKQHGRSGSKK